MKIDKNIPIPELIKKKRKYPLDIMEINDSFFSDSTQNTIRAAISIFRKSNENKEFILRPDFKGNDKGWRVWRIK